MKVYRVLWWGAVMLIGGLGFSVAVLNLPVGDLLVRAFGGAIIGLGSSLLAADLVRHPRAPRPAWAAVVGSVSMVAAVGVRVLVGEATLLLMMAAFALGFPDLLRCLFAAPLRRRPTSASNTSAHPMVGASPLVTAVTAQRLSDEDLAAAWHTSCAALHHAADPNQRLGWIIARQVYLDEFERRSPDLFAGWLAASAGAPNRSGHFP